MANDTTVIQRADKFGIGTTYNPYKNAISTTNLPKQRFKIADTPTYADSPVIIVSTGLVPNLQDFVGGNIVFTIYDTDGVTLLETLIPKAVDIGEGLFPANNEINWFDVVGMQGDFYVNQVWAGKILEISGKFETCSITAEDINRMASDINRMASDINRMASDIKQLASRQPQVKRFLITNINIMNYQGRYLDNYEHKQYTDVIGIFRQRHPNERGEVLFWNLIPTRFTASATASASAYASTATATAELIYNSSAYVTASASASAYASTATAEIKPLALSGGGNTLEVIARATENGANNLSCNFNITAAFWFTVLSM